MFEGPVLILMEEPIGSSMARRLKLSFKAEVHRETFGPPPEDAGSEWVISTFSRLARWIETVGDASGRGTLLGTVCVIELFDPVLDGLDALDPLDSTQTSAAVTAMLVLSFPEVQWVLHTAHRLFTTDTRAVEDKLLLEAHVLSFLDSEALPGFVLVSSQRYAPQYDGSGLRERIRRNVRKSLYHLRSSGEADKRRTTPPERVQSAVAVDDESEYCHFTSWAAYRHGYRVHAARHLSMMQRLFGDEHAVFSPTMSFEDLYLHFPDVAGRLTVIDHGEQREVHLSNLKDRMLRFPALRNVKKRVMVTVGHGRSPHESAEQLKGFSVVHKPLADVFGFWFRAQREPDPWRRLIHWARDVWTRFRSGECSGLALDYFWPPANSAEVPDDHSAPGRLLEIAAVLTNRARRIAASSAQTVPEALAGAVLALDAQEYLGCKTPTTSLHALGLQHQLEAVAESQFYGVAYEIDLTPRWRSLEKGVCAIGAYLQQDRRGRAKVDAELAIVQDLARRYREHNQFDRELNCLAHARKLLRKRRQRTVPLVLIPFLIPYFVIRWYFDQLLSGLVTFIIYSLLIFAVLLLAISIDQSGGVGVVAAMLLNGQGGVFLENVTHLALPTFIGFLSLNPFKGMDEVLYSYPTAWTRWLHAIAGATGMFHLGVFISLLFARLLRR